MGAQLLLLALVALPTPVECEYAGLLQPGNRKSETEGRNFRFTAVIAREAGEAALTYLLEDRNAGGSAWPERYGALTLPVSTESGLRLRHTFDGNLYSVAIRRPVFEFPEHMTGEAEWTVDRAQYVRVGSKKVRERECTQFEVTLDRGRRQSLSIETKTGLLVRLEERLFLGRGDPFELTVELEDVRPMNPNRLQRSEATATALLQLQRELDRGTDPRASELTAAQLTTATTALPRLKSLSPETAWERLVESIERDLAQQSRRAEGLAGLSQKLIGQPVQFPELKLLSGETLTAESLRGKTVLLHFWEYDGEKLVEPYGQVGYLDFLAQRRVKLGAKVIGVAVDKRFGQSAEANAARRSIKKLQEFMNLSYPIALDDGSFLGTIGDPRTLDSKLPFWVVVGHDGKIRHVHAGHYDIRPDEGLKSLDTIVIEGLKLQKQAERAE